MYSEFRNIVGHTTYFSENDKDPTLSNVEKTWKINASSRTLYRGLAKLFGTRAPELTQSASYQTPFRSHAALYFMQNDMTCRLVAATETIGGIIRSNDSQMVIIRPSTY